jgi:hypothetical protein
MCLIISFLFAYLSYSFYLNGSFVNSIVNGVIAIFFIGLLLGNILKNKKDKKLL